MKKIIYKCKNCGSIKKERMKSLYFVDAKSKLVEINLDIITKIETEICNGCFM